MSALGIIWIAASRSLSLFCFEGRSHFRYIKLLIGNQIISQVNRFSRSPVSEVRPYGGYANEKERQFPAKC
ncbi:hypothetical protein IQ269_07410 [Tychonema sp. LEGE 07199]|uniref:hypothetical protein n=1 Tax=unclassified Tychonema TaxID=2642144 RepID=UPI00187E6F74|nr:MULTISPECIES: hypothetical protein [unclassified Tychonema]MBE9120648.1 hypothetical protein [Tychonema sp. LEGE 07199]MBE9132618.1 hypothetical protein [Tychonema sp. LEGE 07196]